MAIATGVASGYNDLLTKLITFLTTEAGWTLLRDAAAPGLTLPRGVNLRGPGAGAGRQVFINIATASDATIDAHYWAITGAIGYSANAAWSAQPGEGPRVYFNLWDGAIDYRFYANGRRFIVVARISTIFVSMYAGFFLPFAAPGQYSFPLMVAADFSAPTAFNKVDAGRRMFCDPGQGAAYVRPPENAWRSLTNQYVGNVNDQPNGFSRGDNYFVWPFSGPADNTEWSWNGRGWNGGNNGDMSVLDRLMPTAQGGRLVKPAQIANARNPPLGDLDGVYMPLGAGIVAEQVVTAEGRTLRAFQNIHRLSGNDFFLVDETA